MRKMWKRIMRIRKVTFKQSLLLNLSIVVSFIGKLLCLIIVVSFLKDIVRYSMGYFYLLDSGRSYAYSLGYVFGKVWMSFTLSFVGILVFGLFPEKIIEFLEKRQKQAS